MKKLNIVGFGLSAIWLIAFAIVICTNWDDAVDMGLNEWGDFFAGLTAPLALMWIVIGYFLQGKELRVNTEALKAQQEELRRQVQETAILAKNSDRQAQAAEQSLELVKLDRATSEHENWLRSRIKLKLHNGITNHGNCQYTYTNIGESVAAVSVGAGISEVAIKGGEKASLHPGDILKLRWQASIPYPIEFALDYRDSSGRKRRAEYSINDKGELSEQAETDQEGNPFFQ